MSDKENNLLFNIKGLYVFITLSIVSCITTYFIKNYVLTSELYYSSLADKLTAERIEELINTNEKWAFLSYIFVPIILVIKFSLISIVLW